MMWRVTIAALIVFACIAFRHVLERDPVTHILVQLPLLILSGALLVPPNTVLAYSWSKGGYALLIIAVTGIAFWMLPRSIDSALSSDLVEVAKFVSLPLFIGVPLKLGWASAHPILRGFLKAEALSMLGVMAFLYTHAPVRICNSYLVSDQERLGYGFLIVIFFVSLLWVTPLFAPRNAFRNSSARTSSVPA